MMHSASLIQKYSSVYDFNIILQRKDKSILSALLPKKNIDSSSFQKRQQQDILHGQSDEQEEQKQSKQVSEQKIYEHKQLISLVVKETLHRTQNQHTRQCWLLENEYEHLRQISYPYIVQLTSERQCNSASCYFTLEKGICDMYDRTFRENPLSLTGLNINEIKACLKQVALSLHHLHSELKVSHNDVKPENIIMFSSNLYKLADFGYAKQLEKHEIYSYDLYNLWKHRSKEYMAPELLKIVSDYKSNETKTYNNNSSFSCLIDESKTDIFSLGISLFIMVFGYLPFKTQDGPFIEDEIFKYLGNKNTYHLFWKKFNDVLEVLRNEDKQNRGIVGLNDLQDLLENMICHNPNQRFSALDIALHPWIQKINQSSSINLAIDDSLSFSSN